jgi:GNAT superfamily N-acetyltransferase
LSGSAEDSDALATAECLPAGNKSDPAIDREVIHPALETISEARRKGLGRALLSALARIAIERGCHRFEWSVLDWNAPALAFYRALGATPLDEWTVHRLTGPALHTLAGLDAAAPR